MYLWPNIAPYVISYFYHFGNQGMGQTDLSLYDTVYVVPMITIMLAVMNPIGAFLYKVVNPRILLFLGNAAGVTAMLLSTTVNTFEQFVACYALLYGAGIGICYLPPLGCGWEWIPDHRGFVTGAILGAFGFGAFIFSFVAQAIVNPDNEQAEELADGRLIYAPDIAARVSLVCFGICKCCFSPTRVN